MESETTNRPTAEQRSTAIAYRPRSFSELVGQEFVAHAITNALEQQAVAHAYLLCGPRGVGKTTTARLLAQYLNHGGQSTDQQWEAIRNGSGLDVIEIDGASNTSVQDVRQIKENILYPPQASRYKIYIIDEVHMLSTSAFNALLKTIEEPPSYVVFIFATTEAEKLPMTVRSRCQQFHFRLIPTDVIAKQLGEVAAQLKIAINQEVVYWIATEAQGSMRDAYTMFDQLSVLGDDLLDLDALRKHFGFAETKQLAELIVLLSQQQIAQAMQLFDTILNAGVSLESVCGDMTQLYRALLMQCYGIEVSHTEMIPSELAGVHNVYTDTELLTIIEELVNVFQSLKDSLNPRFSCELALARIGYVKNRVTAQDIHHTLANMSSGTGASSMSGGTSAPSAAGIAGAAHVTTSTVGGTGAPSAAVTASATGAFSAAGAASAVGTPNASASQPTGTLDPFAAHTSESLRAELTKDIGDNSNGAAHAVATSVTTNTATTTATTTTNSTAPVGRGAVSTENSTIAPSADAPVATDTMPPTDTTTRTVSHADKRSPIVSAPTSHDSSQPTGSQPTNIPSPNNVSATNADMPHNSVAPATSPHADTQSPIPNAPPPSNDSTVSTTDSTSAANPHQSSNELSIDEISQIVTTAVVDKPIIHNLLIHDCTWHKQQTAVTIAAPSEFDKTTLEPYQHALTEAVRSQFGQSCTITLTVSTKNSDTDKLISMTKKMFNAVE